VPLILQSYVYKDQDLKKKYNAKWAVVTGGSSGIGRALSEKLASQVLHSPRFGAKRAKTKTKTKNENENVGTG
jgi:NADP-dependent 3-hydroxy acid dehydrogenase YdfG